MVFLLRRRRWVAVLLAAVAGLLARSAPADLSSFAGLKLSLAYAGNFTQAGPLQLLLSRLLMIGGHDGAPFAGTRVLVDVGVMVLALALCRGNALREAVVGVLTLLWLLGPVPWNGHPAELGVPLLWAYAMVLQRRERWVRAGAALGLSVLIAPVAILGFPCLLAFSRPLRALLVGLAVAVSGYLPFVLLGHFEMFGHVWWASPGSLPYRFGVHRVTWAMRLIQAVVVAGGCAVAALLFRGRAFGMPLLVAGLLRVVTDPMTFSYYWMPAAVGSVMLVALMPPGRWWPIAVAYVGVLSVACGAGVSGALTCLAMIAVISLWSRRWGPAAEHMYSDGVRRSVLGR